MLTSGTGLDSMLGRVWQYISIVHQYHNLTRCNMHITNIVNIEKSARSRVKIARRVLISAETEKKFANV